MLRIGFSNEAVRSPVPYREVEGTIHAVFGERVEERKGTSHRLKVNVPELRTDPRYTDDPDFRFGFFNIVVSGGTEVKAPYLRIAYKAAFGLDLLPT